MDKTRKLADDSGAHRKATFFFSTFGVLLACVACAFGLLLSGCGTPSGAAIQTAETNVTAFNAKVLADASSPEGQQLLAAVTSAALNVGLDVASGNDVGASVAGVQGAAQAVRDYEGLPSAPSSATIAQAAAAGAGVSHVALTLAPAIETIIDNATKSAKAKKLSVPVDTITEAVARGLDAVAASKITAPVRAAIQVAQIGEAP